MSLASLVAEYVPAVDAEMRAVLDGRPERMDLFRYLEYHLGWVDKGFRPLDSEAMRRYGGKRLRPILCLLACRSRREDWARALPAAAAVELIQNFTLIHDDVEDNDPERRHRPTLWKVWGVPQAINAGSCMQALVNTAALRLVDRRVDPARVLESVRILTDTIVELTEGQHLDISYEGRFDVTVADYFAMTTRKTGALCEAATWLGALLATDDADTIAAWRQVGRAFGLAFQARDDILGIWAPSGETGKVEAGDVLKRKKSLPIVYALSHGPETARRAIIEVFSASEIGPTDVERVVAALDGCGAQAYCRGVVEEHAGRALAALERLPAGPAVAEARGLVELVATG
ncbi:MAG: polyprenyl synthetase family protein [Armatimonadetes bacterium]|nr:polyprenyl synthetase family protein [Armatimonadota bacterium]